MMDLIRETAVALATAMADEDGKLHDRIKELEGDLNIVRLQRDAARRNLQYIETLQGMVDDYFVRCSEQEIEIVWLKRPLWVKIVGWFAR